MLYFLSKSDKNTTVVAEINAVYKKNIINVNIIQKWFSKFHNGNFES